MAKRELSVSFLVCLLRMVSPHPVCPLYIILTLIITSSDAVKNITADLGSSVHLPCPSSFPINNTVTVTWNKTGSHGNLCQYRVNKNNVTISSCKPHVNVKQRPVRLYLTRVKISDAGHYTCTAERIIPPPHDEKSYEVTLHVQGPVTVTIERQACNSTDCITLLCEVDGPNPEAVNFTWSRNGQIIPNMSSLLHLCRPDWKVGDTFTCNTTSNYTHYTLKHTPSKDTDTKPILQIIICVGTSVGILAVIGLFICIYKCMKRANSGDGSVVYANKVYENYSFGSSGPQTQRPTTVEQEQCIYEN